ncbi:MAG: YfhO family protein [Oscillospiraceae bacterium]|nr:YfhO family protein [Oscillospiraceae bacterium]
MKNVLTPMFHRVQRFDEKSPRNKRIVYYTVYTILFGIVAALVFSSFFRNDKSFIWHADGLSQHYPTLIYYGATLREILRNFFATGALDIPLWSFSIGYGSDTLTTLHYYAIGDPLALLTAFVPLNRMELLYNALVILRMGLAGIAFSAYCHKMGRGRFATLCASFTYAFCAFALLLSVRHPFFINPMIYLPLLLLGVEKILRKERPYLFIVMVFISLTSNFYFFYMLGILVAVYVLIRLFFMESGTGTRIRNLLSNLPRFALYAGTGILMACVIFIPQLIKLFATTRWNVEPTVDMFYPLEHYQGLLTNFITSVTPSSWTSSTIGTTPIAFLAVILLFSTRKKHKALKAGFVVLTVFLLFPFFGHVMNGFSYVANRWLFGYVFVISLILATMLPQMLKATTKQLLAASVFSAVWLLVYLTVRTAHTAHFLTPFAVFLLCLALLWGIHVFRARPDGLGKHGRTIAKSAILALTLIGILIHAGHRYAITGMNYIHEFVDTNQSLHRLINSEAGLIGRMDNTDPFRHDMCRFTTDTPFHGTMLSGTMGTEYFFSLNEGSISAFAEEILLDRSFENKYRGNDNRAAPSLLASVRYFVVRPGLGAAIPYGFTRTEIETDHFVVYENDHALPFGYTFSAYIPREHFKELTPLQRQNVMLQGAVLDASPTVLPRIEPVLTDVTLPFELELASGVTHGDGVFTVTQGNTHVVFRFIGLENSETYLYIENLHFEPFHPFDLISDDEWEAMSVHERNTLHIRNRHWTRPGGAILFTQAGAVQKSNSILTTRDLYYYGKHDFLINMGYNEDAMQEITLRFSTPGIFTFDDLQVLAQPMDGFAAQAAALREIVPHRIEFGTNRVWADITLDDTRLLAFSIPYNGGWSAYVNGEPADLLRINTMYMGVLLEAGAHSIELRYFTPGLALGLISSGVGFLLFAGIIVFFEVRIRRKKAAKS